MLPGIDDGAKNLDTALEMARISVADGITMTACTPHIYPGLFDNTGEQIKRRVDNLRTELQGAGIPLELTYGADIQIVPELVSGLRSGHLPTLHGTRYFLLEPPHHAVPSGFSHLIFDALASGYVPVITHPERLTWLDDEHYHWFADAAHQGAWIQLTAGSLVGRFGRRAKYWSDRFLEDGLVHILATDAHETQHRRPLLAEGRDASERYVSTEEADLLVTGRPGAIVENRDPTEMPPPPGLDPSAKHLARNEAKKGWLTRLFSVG